ncbi:zf-HC2 domain-containing protein [Streptomyces sp. NBC_00201]|nr:MULTISPECIES: zf-HC2 domain-containing protein [unclassified Streptomyces]MCX5048534.1 zf-HC2 domain-containing protein [Streptomyces sp. NBC_00474]MCX5056721.1 zf-HC2 domain-containing protein [Streptomyces sp. NBC_00452]MCX5246357.1 zf-HC2 domain-containing protein [Streptomyces sp. NBC_00201]MCX5287823.1 zf-HC2 domain-containing protein [Streptomyces sp. NBC_00183]
MMGSPGPSEHETVGAYALGILDDAEATAFEAHLATCEWCAQQLDELAGMEPMMAALADLPGTGSPAIGESLSARPSPRLAERLVDEVSERRAQKRRKGFYLVAAAAALIIGGPLTVMAVNGGSDSGKTATPLAAGAKAAFSTLSDKVTATDPSTKVKATVAMQEKEWGTWGVVELSNVKGPLKCSLIAVGKNGERETMSSWSVPKWGYGIANAKSEEAKEPLYAQGGAALQPNDIDHFEVMTFDGKKLVEIDA